MGEFFDKFSRVPISQKLLLLLLLMAGVFFAFYMLIYSPLEEEIKGLRDTQTGLEREEQQFERYQARVRDLEELVREESVRRERFQMDLPTRARIPELLDELYQLAQTVELSSQGTEFEIRNVRPSGTQRATNYTRIPLSLQLTGTYEQVLEYSWKLATEMERIVHILSINLSVLGSGGRNDNLVPLLNVSMSIESFFRPEG